MKSRIGEPAWEVARLFPNQGHWGEGDYFALTPHSTGLVELRDGHVEILPTPTTTHQFVLGYLMREASTFANARQLGSVLFIPFQVRLRPELIRIPDIVFLRATKAA